MLIRVQGSVRCGICSGSFPLNAAVGSLPCNHCGARVELQDTLWRGVLEEAVQLAGRLEPNASATARYTQHETLIQLQIARVPPTCPHCEDRWTQVPDGPFSCPGCGEAIPTRPAPAAVQGLGRLIGEDRAMLGGEHAERRTPWYLQVLGAGAQGGLADALSVTSLAVDPQGRLYISGSYGDAMSCLLAVDLSPVRLAWKMDLETVRPDCMPQVIVAPFGRLALYEEMDDRVDLVDAATGAHLGRFRAPGPLVHVASQVDGTFLAATNPEYKLIRFDIEGREVPLWPARGLFGRLMGDGITPPMSPPRARMNTAWNTAIGLGWDGDVRVVTPGYVGRLRRDGALVWSTAVAGLSIPSPDTVPGSAKDGTTFALGFDTDGATRGILVRIEADGSNPRILASQDLPFTSLAVMSSGDLWIATATELRHLDRDGILLWRKSG